MKIASKLFVSLCLALVLSLAVIPGALGQQPTPVQDTPAVPAPPAIAARAALMVNAADGQVLFSQNPDERLPMASTTKMMTALLIIESHIDDMNEMVTCSQRAAEVGESSIYLVAGEKLTLKEMLTGLLVQSGNDAATALAEYDAGSVEAFVEKMNKRAAELGLANTHFVNPHGLHDPNHYTTATDFVKLGREVMKHPEIREIVKMQDASIPWSGQPYGRSLINHNHILGLDPAVNGIKTGYTDEAGQCIIISASENGTDVILAYLGGPSISQRNDDVINLIHYGFGNYQQKTVISDGAEYASIDLPFQYGRKLALISDGALSKKIYVGDTVGHKLVLPDKMSLPIHKGDKIGLVEAYEGNKFLGSTYLVSTEEIPKPDFRDRINYYVAAVYNFLVSAIKPG